ncbi:MAG: 50S ribosomal protein L37ae [Candidatus Thermoplasmatota archaeon]|jgi:large subunit ribosomal protein L37Ae|nr:50S ribosomal protein L37ae [Candidatus Thermoplasmatota archaeon]MCL5963304.1 50S ribosomal protein L37ae [Candidatus Thermoplasmatota archaeon]
MSRRTRKVGSVGRMGPRYGVRIRKQILDVEKLPDTYLCPNCAAESVKRVSAGIWECKKCKHTFASNAYFFSTPKAIHREVTGGHEGDTGGSITKEAGSREA